MRLHMRMAGASDPVLELMDAVRGVDRVPVADTVSAETCPICLDDADEVAEIGCDDGHLVCASCLREYLKARVAAGETRDDQLVCPMPKCGWALPEAKVAASLRRTTSGEVAYGRLQDSRARRAAAELPADSGERLVQCPAPDCAPSRCLHRRHRRGLIHPLHRLRRGPPSTEEE